jgi:hypothetical protein
MRLTSCALLAGGLFLIGAPAFAQGCAGLPQAEHLQTALQKSVKASGGPSNGGLDNNMWAAVVDRDGFVCAVVFSGESHGDQWPGSRVIAAQKANTGNAFSLDGLVLGQSLCGDPAGRKPFRAAAEQPDRYGRRLRRQSQRLWHETGSDGR